MRAPRNRELESSISETTAAGIDPLYGEPMKLTNMGNSKLACLLVFDQPRDVLQLIDGVPSLALSLHIWRAEKR